MLFFDSSTVLNSSSKYLNTYSLKCESIDNGYKIPSIVHQTFCNTNLPVDIVNAINNNKQKCKECIFLFYDDNDCDKLIRENFHEDIYNAYKKINPVYGAMRADFFRYCVLYLHGGIYLDIKSKINVSVFKLINKDDICLLDILHYDLEPWRSIAPAYEQWILIFAPRHPYLLSMINLMINYINKEHTPTIIYGRVLNKKGQILNITGPDAFTKAVNMVIDSNKNLNNPLHRNIDYYKYFDLNYNSSYRNMYKINNRKHYSEGNEPIYITDANK